MYEEKLTELEKRISKDYGNIAGIVVRKDGKIQYEHYFNGCSPKSRLHVYSVTKSIISILIGIAVDRGDIESIEQPVLDFFPEYTARQEENTIQRVTLRNLLTMTAPYRYWLAPYKKYFTSDDWVKFTLDLLGGRARIGEFRYAPLIGPDILSGILVNATGETVLDFAKENLFGPLGITVARSVVFGSKEEQIAFNKRDDISGWAADPNGINAGGWGLTLTARDMASIGQLYLDGGIWNGEQIVSSEWVKESTTEQSRWEKQGLSYGYLWWLGSGQDCGYAAMGDGGNVIYVNTDKKLTVSILSAFKRNAKDRMEFIQKYVEPVFEN